MYFPRSATERFLSLLKKFPAVVVSGARQVGKSTFLRHTLGDRADFVVFDPVLDVENARTEPELFLDNHRTPLVLDEVQYAPELLPTLKRRIDRNRKAGQFILTGCQQWGVMKTVSESLAGRVAFLDLDGFTCAEAARQTKSRHWLEAWLESPSAVIKSGVQRPKQPHSLNERLWRGWLPEAHFLPRKNISDFWLAYQRTYIERDARLMADVSDWQQFGRFMRLTAALTACEINNVQFGRDIGISPQTAHRWLGILKSTFQWHEVPAYSGNAVKRVSGKAKGFIADTGLACWALAVSAPSAVSAHPNWGALFETAVFAEIRKAASLISPPPIIYHWRTNGGAEVDFILERNGVFYPIEVKATSSPSRRDTSGISAFRKTYPRMKIAKGLVVSPCEESMPLSGNDFAMPWDAVLVR